MEQFKNLTYYELLGIAQNATPEEIKRAYRQQVTQYHPDHYSKASPDEQRYASERTQRINEAYDVLSNPKKRTMYDLSLPSPTAKQRSKIVSPSVASPPPPAKSRDYQAELYDQGVAHLTAGRYMQAVATLRELQQINPFYRDSATLLSRATTRLNQKEEPAKEQKETSNRPTRRRLFRFSPLLGSIGALIIIGIISALFIIPQFQPSSVSGVESPTTVTEVPLPTPVDDDQIPQADSSTALSLPSATTTSDISTSTTTAPSALNTTTTSDGIGTNETVALESPSTPPHCSLGAGQLIARYDFSSNSEWANMDGEGWRVGAEDGQYHISVDSHIGDLWSYHASPEGTRYEVGTEIQVQGGDAGLALHFTDQYHYLAFLINPLQQSYRIEHHRGQEEPLVIAEEQNDSIMVGETATNRIAACVEDNVVQVFVNGTFITSHNIPQLDPTDRYGLIAVAKNTSTHAIFDNVEIRRIVQE